LRRGSRATPGKKSRKGVGINGVGTPRVERKHPRLKQSQVSGTGKLDGVGQKSSSPSAKNTSKRETLRKDKVKGPVGD